LLAGRLAGRCQQVTGIDRDPHMITLARTQAYPRVAFIEADFLTYPFEAASFDFVCANTSLHHMDFTAALTAMARLLRPGGQLAVVGLAADRSVTELLAGACGVPAALLYRTVRRKGESGAPVLDPDMSWGEVRAAARTLPGVRYRRHLLWRYSLRWRKPGE
jgi:ubiquinone/menaquinone biosynthesis C-methylase UbiE